MGVRAAAITDPQPGSESTSEEGQSWRRWERQSRCGPAANLTAGGYRRQHRSLLDCDSATLPGEDSATLTSEDSATLTSEDSATLTSKTSPISVTDSVKQAWTNDQHS